MSTKASFNKQSLADLLSATLDAVNRYAVLIFLLLLTAVYGFVIYRISAARNAQPSDASVSAQVQASATPHIDPTVINEMQGLQDHSVNVKTLFDQARNNPFHE